MTRGTAIYEARRRRLAQVQPALSPELERIQPGEWTPDHWATPWAMVRGLEEEFGSFELDPACTAETAKAPRFFTPAEDGLTQDWAPSRVFLNPPFSAIAAWIRKSIEEARRGALVVCLAPVRTDMDWWHDLVMPNAEVRFLRGRPRFVGPDGKDNGRPWFALAVLIFVEVPG